VLRRPIETTGQTGVWREWTAFGRYKGTYNLTNFDGKSVIIRIRPEAFLVAASSKANIKVKVTMVENSGADHFASFELGGQAIIARLPGHLSVDVGQSLPLAVDLETLCYFDPETGQRIN